MEGAPRRIKRNYVEIKSDILLAPSLSKAIKTIWNAEIMCHGMSPLDVEAVFTRTNPVFSLKWFAKIKCGRNIIKMPIFGASARGIVRIATRMPVQSRRNVEKSEYLSHSAIGGMGGLKNLICHFPISKIFYSCQMAVATEEKPPTRSDRKCI